MGDLSTWKTVRTLEDSTGAAVGSLVKLIDLAYSRSDGGQSVRPKKN